MLNNPFAPVFRQALYSDVLKNSLYTDRGVFPQAERVHVFMNEFNRFLKSAGERPVLYQHYAFEEEKLLDFALFLRGYMRDAQQVLGSLTFEYANDNDLGELFKASSKYAVACNQQMHNKRIFKENTDYRCWKMDSSLGVKNAAFTDAAGQINVDRRNLLLFMPFRIKENPHEVQKWVYNNVRNLLDDNSVYGEKVDSYVIHFPIQKSRGEGIYSLMNTIRCPDTYFEQSDMTFVRRNLSPLIGKNLVFDEQNRIVGGEKLAVEELKENFSHITIFGYCIAAANAHRCLNALYSLGRQMYDETELRQAMSGICLISYGFLPAQRYSLYSGVHFFSHKVDDTMQKEPFAKLNNPGLYEQVRCADRQLPARISVMEDGRNYVIALQNKGVKTIVSDGQFVNFDDKEYGHSLLNVNTPDLRDKDNFSYNLFFNVLKNASLGMRGQKLIRIAPEYGMQNSLTCSCLFGQRQRL